MDRGRKHPAKILIKNNRSIGFPGLPLGSVPSWAGHSSLTVLYSLPDLDSLHMEDTADRTDPPKVFPTGIARVWAQPQIEVTATFCQDGLRARHSFFEAQILCRVQGWKNPTLWTKVKTQFREPLLWMAQTIIYIRKSNYLLVPPYAPASTSVSLTGCRRISRRLSKT